MIVEVTESKYNVGCGRGYGIDIPNLALKLNLIIDKYRSTWPTPPDPRTDEEKEAGIKFPEPTKEIQEGDVFVLDGTVFAVDHDRLVQVVSETGVYAFKRIYEEIIKPEIEFSYFDDDDNEYSWEELEKLPDDKVLSEYTPPYEWMKIWRENFVKDRNLRPDYTIQVTIKDIMLGFTREIYMKSSKVYYLDSQFSEDELKYYLRKTLCWFYSEIGRVRVETKKLKTLEDIE